VTEPRDPATAAPDVGRLVDGRYRLGAVIGVGGMATVHRALDTKFDRPVAIKLLRREVIEDTDIAMRFRREALAATVLRHPNIVACLETGTDDGQPYLVMELIEGEDLAARLRRGGRLAPAEAARIGLDVARALGVAHVRGIVHRDVKPGNILLARDGRAMVTDFGIARLAADAEGAVPGTTLGSVHYFSPEQATGATTTPSSDVYSLGLVLYESLTGQRAWSGESTASLAAARIGSVAPSPRAIRPEVPMALDAIVVRALDPEPARRYPNGNAMAAALASSIGVPDPSSPTVAIPTAALVASAAAAGARSAEAATSLAPPLRPAGAGGAALPFASGPTIRRASPAIAGPLVVLLAVVAVVVGALFVASLSGGDGPGGLAAIASASTRPARTPSPAPKPTARPTVAATPKPTAKPTAVPTPTAKPKPGTAADACDPFLGIPCSLGKGTYQPSRFSPPVRFTLGDGWGVTTSQPTLLALNRDEGVLTLASAISTVYPSGDPTKAPSSVRNLVETFIGTDGVASGKLAATRVDKRRATAVDLAPTGPDRVPLFGAGDQTFYLEPDGTTRIIVVDGKDGVLVIAIEPAEDSTLETMLPKARSVVNSLRFQ
jgi:serine/threonine-protein kinase